MINEKRIIIISLGKEYGGAEKVVKNIIDSFQNDLKVFVVLNNKNKLFEEIKNEKKIKVIGLNHNLKNLIKNISKIKLIIKKEKINLIHSHGIISGLIGTILRKLNKVKFIITIHSDVDNDFYGLKRRIYKTIENYSIKKSDKTIVVSSDLANKLKLRVKSKDTTVINNGIKKIEVNIKKKKEKIFTISSIGRLEKIKNIEFLIEGIFILQKKYNIECKIIGEGSQKDILINKVKDLGLENCVTFLGYQNNAIEYIANSELLVMTSKMEGIPITIIEAFMSKTLVLSSGVGGVFEMIKDGYNGVLYKEGDIDDFHIRMCNIIDGCMNRENIVTNAYKDYEKKWSLINMKREYEKFYYEI